MPSIADFSVDYHRPLKPFLWFNYCRYNNKNLYLMLPHVYTIQITKHNRHLLKNIEHNNNNATPTPKYMQKYQLKLTFFIQYLSNVCFICIIVLLHMYVYKLCKNISKKHLRTISVTRILPLH